MYKIGSEISKALPSKVFELCFYITTTTIQFLSQAFSFLGKRSQIGETSLGVVRKRFLLFFKMVRAQCCAFLSLATLLQCAICIFIYTIDRPTDTAAKETTTHTLSRGLQCQRRRIGQNCPIEKIKGHKKGLSSFHHHSRKPICYGLSTRRPFYTLFNQNLNLVAFAFFWSFILTFNVD